MKEDSLTITIATIGLLSSIVLLLKLSQYMKEKGTTVNSYYGLTMNIYLSPNFRCIIDIV